MRSPRAARFQHPQILRASTSHLVLKHSLVQMSDNPRKRRRLQYEKCKYCRRDKKKVITWLHGSKEQLLILCSANHILENGPPRSAPDVSSTTCPARPTRP